MENNKSGINKNSCKMYRTIVILIYSILSGHANYPKRISQVQNALNETKRIKRDLVDLIGKEPDYQNTYQFKKIKEEYEVIIKSAEARKDEDFFWTVRAVSASKGYKYFNAKIKDENLARQLVDDERKELIGYIKEITPCISWFKIIVKKGIHALIYITPIIVYMAGFLKKGHILQYLLYIFDK